MEISTAGHTKRFQGTITFNNNYNVLKNYTEDLQSNLRHLKKLGIFSDLIESTMRQGLKKTWKNRNPKRETMHKIHWSLLRRNKTVRKLVKWANVEISRIPAFVLMGCGRIVSNLLMWFRKPEILEKKTYFLSSSTSSTSSTGMQFEETLVSSQI